MPTANDELRQKMVARFGSIELGPPLAWLRDRGFIEYSGFFAAPSDDYVLSDEEADCIDFLCMEWDFSYEGPRSDAFNVADAEKPP